MPKNYKKDLREKGYSIFPSLVPKDLANSALEAIQTDLKENYDDKKQSEYDNISYCPDLRGEKVIKDLLRKSKMWKILDEAIGVENIEHDVGQIAIRKAHNADQNYPPEPHIDGIPTPQNGVTGNEISNFTALVGFFLSTQTSDFAGNFTVWEGSHHKLENYFRERGEKAQDEGMPMLDFGEPEQLICDFGDAVFCHYQMAHAAAVNTSDVDRIAVYFRIWLKGIEKKRWHYLTNIWDGWKI